MLDEIKRKYGEFSDSLILKFTYEAKESSQNLEVIIHCMNELNNYEFETVKLSFVNVISFRFIENERTSSVLVNSAFLERKNGVITFDFSPSIYSSSDLRENKNSDL
ncbi:hypothetical protein LVD17_01250 [Fulvivirga ulvae]|uniref:hypothetical protein n=1 Tax=Fulvivirga ulvae TaxID=2904245 RepID=UPI001F1BD390|nr:hypothetical protein [Fulvivirga ulvae]UII32465.1 hypothetical protein LVD17_01250 [Fulvivirga ulvae]